MGDSPDGLKGPRTVNINYTAADAINFGDEMYDLYISTKAKLKDAEDTLALIDFDVFAMEADYLKLQADHETLKGENKRLNDLLTSYYTYLDCR
jgi:hypothetical protein